ncbi:MAG: ArsI/CadI family heavy metal resistance metalloenzyme [Myxococcota bacterium]
MRFQLALNVRDLDEAIDYYSRLLGAPVNKRKPGYANFAVEDPPIKLVLFEAPDAPERLNHVGFEMDAAEVAASAERLEPQGLASQVIEDETCCYAKKTTVYAHDPQGLMWEFYQFRGDSETFGEPAPEPPAPAQSLGRCC